MNEQTATVASQTSPSACADETLLMSDELLRRSLLAIERRGTFYDAEQHSAADVKEFDAAQDCVGKHLATTIDGILAKAWVAWSAITEGGSDAKLRFGDMVRRRDLHALELLQPALDWEHQTMLTLVCSLTEMATKSERVPIDRQAPNLANELSSFAAQAMRLEGLLLRTRHVLEAIHHGGLLDAAPANKNGSASYDMHSAAVGLLDMLEEEIERYESSSEFDTDLSIHLSLRSHKLSAAA